MTGERFDGWVPLRLYWRGGEPIVEWCYLGSAPLSDPFLVETIQKAVDTPFGSLFRRHTRMSALERWRELSPGVPPAGFIFHSSRCGSTLISRMLSQLSENLVLSEPEPVTAIVHSQFRSPHASPEQRVEWLRNLMSALGQRRGRERKLFVKLEPHDIFMLPLFRMAYPEVPWLFLYRDPIEVLVSNLRQPPAYLTGGLPPGTGVDLTGVREPDECVAATLGAVMKSAAAASPDPSGMLIHYRDLPDALWGSIARHFGLSFTAAEIAAFRDAAKSDAKRPDRPFVPDGEHKRAEASARTVALAARWIEPHFARLEAFRVS
jgi:hypothetical protein